MSWFLNIVDKWAAAQGYWLEREIGCVLEAKLGRLDGLLVPIAWDAAIRKKWRRFGLLGVELKTNRSDFLKGKRTGQFERYRDDGAISGLYVAAPQSVCKTSELPKGVGHLVLVSQKGRIACICRQHPTCRKIDTPSRALWNVICRMQLAHNQEIRELREKHRVAMKKVGTIAGATIFQGVREFVERLEAESEIPAEAVE